MTRLSSPPLWLRWGTVIAVAAALFVASVVPPSGGVPELGPLGLVGFDKWLHTAGYAGLGAALFVALRPTRRLRDALALAVCLAAVYGVGIELVQALFPARQTDPTDALANTVGAILGGLVGVTVTRFLPVRDTATDDSTTE